MSWVSQLRTLDVVVEVETSRDAEAQVRTCLRNSAETQPWLDSATVVRSAVEPAAAVPPRNPAVFPPSQQLLITAEAGKYLGVGRTKIYDLISSGALESVTIGRARRVSVAQLHRYLESQS